MFSMFRKMICLVSLVLVMGLVSNVQAEWYDWNNATGDGLWSTAGNWSGEDGGTAGPIAAGDGTNLYSIPGPIVDSSVATTGLDGGVTGDSVFTMNGGTLGYDWFNLADSGGTTGTLNMNSGTLSVEWDFGVGASGTGIINMAGGTINVGSMPLGGWDAGAEGYLYMTDGNINTGDFVIGGWEGGTGHVELLGGNIDAGWLGMADSGGSGTMNIEAGTMTLDGDNTWIQGFIDNGWITGYGGVGTAMVSYDGQTTTLYAVPEPATMCLLGLGGLLLLIRRSA